MRNASVWKSQGDSFETTTIPGFLSIRYKLGGNRRHQQDKKDPVLENHECNSDVLHLCFVSTLKVSEQRRVWLDQQSIPPSLTGYQKTVLKVSHEGKRKTKMWSLTLNHTQKINSSCNVKGSKYENILIDENREEEIYNLQCFCRLNRQTF